MSGIMSFLEFMFRSGWHFAGTLLVLVILGSILEGVVSAWREK